MKYFLCRICKQFPNIIEIYNEKNQNIYYKCNCGENIISIKNYFLKFYREIDNINLKKIDKCKIHNEILNYYCNICNEFYCNGCKNEGIHNFHSYMNLKNNILDSEKLKMELKNKKNYVDNFINSFKENILIELKMLINKIENLYKKYNETNNYLFKIFLVFLNSLKEFPIVENYSKNIIQKFFDLNDLLNLNDYNYKYPLNEKIERLFFYLKNENIIKLKNFKVEDMKIKYNKAIKSNINCLIVLKDGRIAVSKNENNRNIYIYEIKEKEKLNEEMILEGHNRKINYLYELKDKRIISCDSKEIKIWTVTNFSYKCDYTINTNSHDINQIIQLQNEKILTCSKNCYIIQWNNKNFVSENILFGTKPFYSITEINEKIIVSSSQNLSFWDLKNGNIIKEINNFGIVNPNQIIYYKNKIYCLVSKQLFKINCLNFQIEICYVFNFEIKSIFFSKNFGLIAISGSCIFQFNVDEMKIISSQNFNTQDNSFDLENGKNIKIYLINQINNKLLFAIDNNSFDINLLE